VAVRVELADRIDWTVSAPQGKPLRIGPVQTDAKFAFVSVTPSGEVLTAWMLGGTELHCNGASVTLPSASLVFDVERVEGSNVYAKSAMDQSHCLVGGYLLTEDTGFEIQAVEGNCITVRDTPMIPCTTATILHSVSLQRQPRPGQESR
jgi:hypothetical protein